MNFDDSKFAENLQRKANSAQNNNNAAEEPKKVIDIDSIRIKDADDVPITSYNPETPRDRKTKLERYQEENKKKTCWIKKIPKGWLYIICVVLASIILSLIAWFAIKDCFAFGAKVSEDIPIVIEEGEGLSKITSKLSDADVIDFPMAFKMYYKFVKRGTKVQYGTHYFRKSDDYDTILSTLSKATESRETHEFLIIEGKTQEEVIRAISKEGYASSGDLAEAINFASFDDYEFVQNLPDRAARLEGYLFPAKYEIYDGESANSIVIRMLKKFDTVFDDIMKDRAQELGMTVDEVITLASIIQAEAGNEDEMPMVSSVFHNRLNDPSFGYLQSCATVQYTMSERKDILTLDDIAVDNKYNTYKYPGLPAGPICNPGLAAIEAALYPADTNYYYFVSNMEGGNIFSVTYAEHLKAKQKALYGGGAVTGTNITGE